MTSERTAAPTEHDLDTLRVLFEQALEQAPDARAAWLMAQVPDSDLRTRLERLLSADATAGALDEPAAARAARLDFAVEVPSDQRIGKTYAGFRLLRLLGEGGMAAVYLAEREHADFRQLAAVKLLRRNLIGDFERLLFQRERRALAALDHPHIARLIDGGVSGDGVPFLVLDYIDGTPITVHSDDHALSVPERVRLMMDVCRAVAAAHRALVVHRDLKPSNILVDRNGWVTLLDFGIAKLLGDGEVGAGGPPTAQYVFTPEYGAPEQFSGAAISTATDVFALGVILHELLLGERPHDRPTPRSTRERTHSQRDEATASRALALRRRALARDLGTVLQKALEEEPARRYPDAAALADDLQRFIEARPVHAHPPSRWYRTRKFVERHRGGVALTTLLIVGILAGAATALWQAQVARSEARRATEVQALVEALFAPLESGTSAERSPSVAQLLERGLERIEREPPRDAQVRAELLGFFARVNDGIGEIQSNLALSERAAQAAAAAWGADDRRSLDAHTLWGRVLRKAGQYQRADEVLESVGTRMRELGIGGLAYAQVLDAQLNARLGYRKFTADEVLSQRRELLALRQSDPASTPEDLATGYNNLGIALEGVRDYPAAVSAHRRAFELRYAALGDSAAAASSLANVANATSWMKRWHEALELFDQARAMYERAGIARHHGYAGLLTRRCDIESLLELHDAAAAACAASVAMNAQLFGTAHTEYAWALTRQAGQRLAAGDMAGAAAGFEDARRVLDRIEGSPATLRLRIDIAEAGRWRLGGDYATLRDRLLPIVTTPSYAEHWAAPVIFAWFALACEEAPASGCDASNRAAADAVLAKPRFADDPLRLPALTALARIDLRHGRRDAAANALTAALASVREIGPNHSWRGEAWAVLAVASATPQARADAAAKARAIFAALPPGHPLRAVDTMASEG
jgi:serine/threonine-protein kinase